MVYKKEQILGWFRTLDGAKRIDFLNGLLHLCFPLELRFVGSCIEELARKDYNYLRDAESKANSSQEIASMSDIKDRVTRSKMIVTLALLHSSNQECARLLYDILNLDDIINILNNTKIDNIIADEYLLLYTMAANHPAFDFYKKTFISDQLKKAEIKLKHDNSFIKGCLNGNQKTKVENVSADLNDHSKINNKSEIRDKDDNNEEMDEDDDIDNNDESNDDACSDDYKNNSNNYHGDHDDDVNNNNNNNNAFNASNDSSNSDHNDHNYYKKNEENIAAFNIDNNKIYKNEHNAYIKTIILAGVHSIQGTDVCQINTKKFKKKIRG